MTREEKILSLSRKIVQLDEKKIDKVIETADACRIVQIIREADIKEISEVINI
ncbi:hypothetical protein [Terrisporobacter sp.]|uniref:hypothetical protein n=1 Tax=Terrisporobacter sp. TaxID=1965305 RepID=UPI00289E7D56|nr:hypothetical protein [Terrisporobacter sp.]